MVFATSLSKSIQIWSWSRYTWQIMEKEDIQYPLEDTIADDEIYKTFMKLQISLTMVITRMMMMTPICLKGPKIRVPANKTRPISPNLDHL